VEGSAVLHPTSQNPMEAQPPTLSSRPKRSAVEGSAVLRTSLRNVFLAGAERSAASFPSSRSPREAVSLILWKGRGFSPVIKPTKNAALAAEGSTRTRPARPMCDTSSSVAVFSVTRTPCSPASAASIFWIPIFRAVWTSSLATSLPYSTTAKSTSSAPAI
jgi:hypothetical protein